MGDPAELLSAPLHLSPRTSRWRPRRDLWPATTVRLEGRKRGSAVAIAIDCLLEKSMLTDTNVLIHKRNLSIAHNVIAASQEGTKTRHGYDIPLIRYSDLLVRHERLTHKKENAANHDELPVSTPNKRRKTLHKLEDQDVSIVSPVDVSGYDQSHVSAQSTNSGAPSYRVAPFSTNIDRGHDFLTTLSFAAEQAALRDSLASSATNEQSTLSVPAPPYSHHRTEPGPYSFGSAMNPPTFSGPAPPAQMSPGPQQIQAVPMTEQDAELDFDGSLDNLAAFLDNGALSSYHFSSVISAEQPVPFFSPESLSFTGDPLTDGGIHMNLPSRNQSPARYEEQSSFSRFGSRLPSLQPEERSHQSRTPSSGRRPLADLSQSDIQAVGDKFQAFSSAVSVDFRLPSRLAFSRYLAAYISGFHEHLPFLHIPTMSIETCSIELILAMAAVGAQYCFEGDRGVELFHASQAIASKRIRCRDTRLAASHREYRSSSIYSQSSISQSGPLALPSYAGTPDNARPEEDLMQTAQALLVLMAMATWAKHKEILREALSIQSILATLVREDGLKCPQLDPNASWEDWVRMETVKRTKFIVFCFFNLHCIVYNIPPLILNGMHAVSLGPSYGPY